jgi:hypothetical protein
LKVNLSFRPNILLSDQRVYFIQYYRFKFSLQYYFHLHFPLIFSLVFVSQCNYINFLPIPCRSNNLYDTLATAVSLLTTVLFLVTCLCNVKPLIFYCSHTKKEVTCYIEQQNIFLLNIFRHYYFTTYKQHTVQHYLTHNKVHVIFSCHCLRVSPIYTLKSLVKEGTTVLFRHYLVLNRVTVFNTQGVGDVK